MIKRIFDIFFASMGLAISSPLWVIISVCIKFDSEGPILFKQKRIGLKGNPFLLYKFRSMLQEAELNGPEVTTNKDYRVTKIGYFLRKYKLDELPQLINIIKGDMSLVGPRPEVWSYKDLFEGKYKKILNYVPGVFGPNQLTYRNESDLYPVNEDPKSFYYKVLFPKKADQDLAYFKDLNFKKDFKLILKGIWASIFKAKD